MAPAVPPPSPHPLPLSPLPFSSPFTAPHASATLALSSGTPAAICRRQAWAVKHRDPEFSGPVTPPPGAPGQMALPTKRGFTAGLKEDNCRRRAEDELKPQAPSPSSLLLPPALPRAKFQLHSPPKRRRFNISVMIILQQMIRYRPKGQSQRIGGTP